MSLELAISGQVPEGVNKGLLDQAISEIYDQVGISGTINLKLIDDTRIHALNKKYAGHDKATDVLSFSYIEDGAASVEGELGDIAISLETAARQAKQAKTDLATEVTLLLIHGALHIFGRDHANPLDLAEMEAAQASIMKKLNLNYRNFAWHLSEV